jgi:TonB family protein
MTAANLLSYSAQVTLLIAVCAALPRLLGLRSAGLQYVFWRVLLAVCLVLPFAQPWRHEIMEFVPAAAGHAGSLSATDTKGPPPPRSSSVPLEARLVAAAGMILLGGIGARLAWLSLGVSRLRRMRERALEAAGGFDDLQRTIGVRADIRWSGDARHPVAFGVFRPVVLLPESLRAADAAAHQAVVAHELHHVKRRDWPVVVAEEVVRSIFWFHPAMWWLVSRVQLARETVVDELSILTTNARRAYLDALLAFADDGGLASTPAFSARRHLFHRVMLLSKEGNMSSIRIAVGSCVLVFALGAGAWGAVYAFPLADVEVVATPLPAPHFENARNGISLESRQQQTVPQTRPTPGQLPPPPRPAREVPPPPPPPPPPPQSDIPPMPESFKNNLERLHPIRVGGNVIAPAKIRDVKPAYPDDARAAHIEGVVIVEAIVDTDGTVADVRVLRPVPALDEAALKAVSQWQFAPTLMNGEPTAALITVTVSFRLQ